MRNSSAEALFLSFIFQKKKKTQVKHFKQAASAEEIFICAMAESEDDEYEEDYEDESFESFPGSNGPEAVTSDAAPGDSGASGGDEVVSLEEYMNRLEQQVAERDEDTNEIMSTITRGLDGLSPPSGHRNHNKASPDRQPSTGSSGKVSRKHTEEDDGDYILKKFNVKMSPSKADDEVSPFIYSLKLRLAGRMIFLLFLFSVG